MLEVDAIEQHSERGRVDLGLLCTHGDARKAEASLLEALVVEDEAAAVPGEDLDAVAATAAEDEEMAAVQVMSASAHEAPEPVDAAAEIDRASGQEDLHGRGKRQHDAGRSAQRISTTKAADTPAAKCSRVPSAA